MRFTFLAVVLMLLVVAGLAVTPVSGSQPSRQSAPLNQLVSLLDEGKVVFGMTANFRGTGNSPIAAMSHAGNDDIDLIMYDMEHNPFDVTELRTYMSFCSIPGPSRAPATSRFRRPSWRECPRTAGNSTRTPGWSRACWMRAFTASSFPTSKTPEQALTAVRAMRYPQEPGAPDEEPAGIRGSGAAVAARYWGLSEPEYKARSDIWRLDQNGNLVPWFIIENKLGVANVREIARQLKEKNVGAVLWAGTGDLGASYNNDQQAVADAVDAILAAGKEFGLPVAMNGSANITQRVAQGARIFMGGVTAAARREAGR